MPIEDKKEPITCEDRKRLNLYETNKAYLEQNPELHDKPPGGSITTLYLVSKEEN